ncbi:MAG: hypothetical protein WCC58_05790, partial [Burkholderiales bacterium]
MPYPRARALFTPWARSDDEMQIRIRRSKATGIVVSVVLHLLFVLLWLHTQKNFPRVAVQGSSNPINVFMIPEPAAPGKSAATQPPRKPKPVPAQRRSAVVTAPTVA